MHKPLSRRQILKGGCAALSLPFLDAMLPRSVRANERAAKPRMLFVYFATGVCNEQWYPQQTGKDFTFSPTLKALEPHRDDVTVLSGLRHEFDFNGHSAADTWLTADNPAGNNSISVDQLAVPHLGNDVRFPSLQLSVNSGTGKKRLTHTLSFNQKGTPIPAQSDPRNIFNRLFVAPDAKSLAEAERRLHSRRSILDDMRQQVAAIQRNLGDADSKRLTEYLESIREVEQAITREEAWLRKPKPEADAIILESGGHRIATKYNLIQLALKSNSTRIISYLSSREITRAHGDSHHGGQPEKLARLAESDRQQVELFSTLLTKLKNTPDVDGNLLDNTMIVFGSGMNNGDGFKNGTGSHGVRKIPLVFAGGRNFGIKNGQHLMFPDDKTTFGQVFVTMLERAGLPDAKFKQYESGLSGLS
jgi:hypothetical protein